MTLQYIDILGLTPGTVSGSDVYPAVDVNDPAQNPLGTTKKYLIANLYAFILQQFGFITLPSAIAATSGTNLNATYYNGPANDGINATLTDASLTFAPLFIDGIAAVVGSPYLIKDQTNPAQNGIYFLTQNGDGISLPWILIRTFYFNSPVNIINGEIVFVTSGLTNANTTWQLSAPSTVVVGTSALMFNLFVVHPFIPTFPWTNVTATSVNFSENNGYVMNNNVTPVTGTLPITCAFGAIIEVAGQGNAGWIVAQNAGQQINFGNLSTTNGTGGSLLSTNLHDAVRLLCVVPNTTFNVLSVQGNLTVV
jgi:hypothetical protein